MNRFPCNDRAAAPGAIRGRSVAFAVIGLLVGTVPASAQFSVQPVILEMRVAGGATERMITIRNDSDEPLQLRVYGSDFDQPESGGHTFMDSGTHPSSCADRLAFEPDNVLLEPQGSGEVRVRMEPGDETCWSLIFVQTVSRGETGIQIAQRIGVKVYGVSATARAEGELGEVRVGEDAEGRRQVELSFLNLGDAPVRPEGEIEVRSESGEVVAVVAVPPFSVLPGRTAWSRVLLEEALPEGVYVVVPILDFGADYLAGGQALLRVGGSGP